MWLHERTSTDRTLARPGRRFDRLRSISPDSRYSLLVTSYASTASEINSMNSWQMSTKMYTWTNVVRPLWVYYVPLACVCEPHSHYHCLIYHACSAVFIGARPSGNTFDLRNCRFKFKAIISTLNQSAIHTPYASLFVQLILAASFFRASAIISLCYSLGINQAPPSGLVVVAVRGPDACWRVAGAPPNL